MSQKKKSKLSLTRLSLCKNIIKNNNKINRSNKQINTKNCYGKQKINLRSSSEIQIRLETKNKIKWKLKINEKVIVAENK